MIQNTKIVRGVLTLVCRVYLHSLTRFVRYVQDRQDFRENQVYCTNALTALVNCLSRLSSSMQSIARKQRKTKSKKRSVTHTEATITPDDFAGYLASERYANAESLLEI